MRRRQLAHRAEDRARFGNVAEREILLDCERIDRPVEPGVQQQRLDLGREQQVPVRQQRVVQRLDAQAVARKEERLAVAIPQCEGKHAAEAFHAALAPRLPGMHDHLGVAARVEAVTERLQLRYQRLVVVDLAVVDDDDRAILVVERLLAGREVDDREAAMAERHTGLEVHAVSIRAPVGDRVVHAQREPPCPARASASMSTMPAIPHIRPTL